jgi:hypothetical protein
MAGAGGLLCGSGWAATLGWVGQTRTPAVEVTGIDSSQLLVIDAAGSRALILAGPAHPALMQALHVRMGLFRQRLDLVFATQLDMKVITSHFKNRWNVGATYGLPGDETGIAPHAQHAITDAMEFRLSPEIVLHCIPQYRLALPHPTWRIEIRWNDQRIVIAASLDDLLSVATSTLAIAPVGLLSLAQRTSVAQAFALNNANVARQIGNNPPPVTLVPVFDSDVARFKLLEGKIRLPDWTLLPGDIA